MPRELIEPHRATSVISAREKGAVTSRQVDVGRSLSADRRSKAKMIVKKGEGDCGDRRRVKHLPNPPSAFRLTAEAPGILAP